MSGGLDIKQGEALQALAEADPSERLAMSIAADWMRHCGYTDDEIADAFNYPHNDRCEHDGNGWECIDDNGISNHPLSDELANVAELVVFTLAAATGPPAEDLPAHFRLRWRLLGAHVHVQVFAGPDRYLTHGGSGRLIFTEPEWVAFQAVVGDRAEIVAHHDPLPEPPA